MFVDLSAPDNPCLFISITAAINIQQIILLKVQNKLKEWGFFYLNF